MKFWHILNTSSQPETSETVAQHSTHPAFWVIVGVVAVCFVIMIVQNFLIKKEEYYK